MTAEITKLNLVRFGKFKDFEIEVDSGLNVIYGANEAGKSTINLFLKAMLYGMPTRKKAGEVVKERERAVPWNEKNAEGILTVKTESRIIEVRRIFGKTAQGDKLEVCDSATGEKIDDFKEGSIGQWLFGVSQTVFEKTLWIGQNGAYIGGHDEELLKKIVNLTDGGDENVSAGEALKKLSDMRKEIRARDKRSTAGKLDVLEERLDSCVKEKYELSTMLSQEEATRVRKKEAEEELLNVSKEIENLEKSYKESLEYEKSLAEIEVYKRICDCDTKIQDINNSEEFRKGSSLTEDITEKAEYAQERIDTLENELIEIERLSRDIKENNSKGSPVLTIIIGAVLGILGIIGIVLSVTAFSGATLTIISVIICVISAITLALGVKRIETAVKGQLENEKKRSQLDVKRVSIAGEKDALNKDLERIFKEYDVSDARDLKRAYLSVQGLMERLNSIKALKDDLCSKYDLEELKETAMKFTDREAEPTEVIDIRLKEARQRHLELTAEIKGLESKMAYQVSEHRIPADIDTEINAVKEDIKAYRRKLLVIDTAIENLTTVAEEWKTAVTPKLNSAVNEIMSYLTAGRYSEVRVSDEFSMRVISEKGLYDAEYLSRGTYEQLYFALRVALAKIENDENPMFLDDILTVYDDLRAEAALKYLAKVNKGSVFLFTCHQFIKEKADTFGANIINL